MNSNINVADLVEEYSRYHTNHPRVNHRENDSRYKPPQEQLDRYNTAYGRIRYNPYGIQRTADPKAPDMFVSRLESAIERLNPKPAIPDPSNPLIYLEQAETEYLYEREPVEPERLNAFNPQKALTPLEISNIEYLHEGKDITSGSKAISGNRSVVTLNTMIIDLEHIKQYDKKPKDYLDKFSLN